MHFVFYALIGVAAGILSGFMGVGGGIIIVPLLILLLGYDQLSAQGTSLGVLVLPVVLMGFLQYYRNPAVNINLVAVGVIALTFVAGGYLGGRLANQLDPVLVRKCFAVFIVINAGYLFFKR
jgi:uncharacterized membrane protein YfcA